MIAALYASLQTIAQADVEDAVEVHIAVIAGIVLVIAVAAWLYNNVYKARKVVAPSKAVLHIPRQTYACTSVFGMVTLLLVLPMLGMFTYLCTLDTPSKRLWLQTYLNSPTSQPIEVDYASDCHPEDITYDTISNKLDNFAIAHFLGWFLMGMLTRDMRICILLFTCDEVLELWWKPVYPNFSECLWDSVFLDILICNILGLYLGVYTVKNVLKWQLYDWFRIFRADAYERGGAGTVMIVIYKVYNFFAHFGIKSVLWLEPSHPLNTIHMLYTCVLLKHCADQMYDNIIFHERHYSWIILTWLFCLSAVILCCQLGYHDPIWASMNQTGQVATLAGLGLGTVITLYFLLV